MSVSEYNEILERVTHLDTQARIRLLADLAILLRDGDSTRKLHDITEFQGIAKGVWDDVDVQDYIKQERDSWED